MQPQMLQLSILVLSERLHLSMGYVLQVNPAPISTNRRHRGRSTTPRNQQHKNFVINSPLSLSRSELRRMVGPTNIHLVRIFDTRITIEDCWSDEFLEIKGREGQRNCWSYRFFFIFLSSINTFDVKKRSFAGRLARDFL